MDELVQRLSDGEHPVTAGGPNPSVTQFKQSIDREYVHIKFTGTRGGTDLGVKLDKMASQLDADFEQGVGTVHIEGTLTLNYVPVRCVATIDLATLNGTGHLVVLEQQPAS
ncbi:MAG: MbtH domain protein [Chloroflexi bacterium AL-W]|nr:MbtH domain protein [Chloroflexi bacterium AL-N1]NOK71325.1 MbtH domain protein [Chloroflexi bacterium AL-N10]NOK78671.1 MbtH domain protein [Chloroflexi bacterium AL-N5]NOK85967.1 MbtH domain protein [Chloroflexi bacterium AL-W]NOK93050.1 MbtH domain protein [Chloroflexi bacterium AL-N15]